MQHFEKTLRVLTRTDGSWEAVESDWSRQCATYEWELADYAIGALPIIRELAGESTDKAKVLALFDEDGVCHAICQANVATLPGYQNPVLRVRHLLLSPDYDFGNFGEEEYSSALTSIFAGIIGQAFGEMRAKHIKFHLRSPADVMFFRAIAKAFSSLPTFDTVQMKGAWLYLDLAEMP